MQQFLPHGGQHDHATGRGLHPKCQQAPCQGPAHEVGVERQPRAQGRHSLNVAFGQLGRRQQVRGQYGAVVSVLRLPALPRRERRGILLVEVRCGVIQLVWRDGVDEGDGRQPLEVRIFGIGHRSSPRFQPRLQVRRIVSRMAGDAAPTVRRSIPMRRARRCTGHAPDLAHHRAQAIAAGGG